MLRKLKITKLLFVAMNLKYCKQEEIIHGETENPHLRIVAGLLTSSQLTQLYLQWSLCIHTMLIYT